MCGKRFAWSTFKSKLLNVSIYSYEMNEHFNYTLPETVYIIAVSAESDYRQGTIILQRKNDCRLDEKAILNISLVFPYYF